MCSGMDSRCAVCYDVLNAPMAHGFDFGARWFLSGGGAMPSAVEIIVGREPTDVFGLARA